MRKMMTIDDDHPVVTGLVPRDLKFGGRAETGRPGIPLSMSDAKTASKEN